MNRLIRVLFVCTHNAVRSQMAEGLLRAMAGSHVEVASAGMEATRVHPLAIRVMEEIGIDLTEQTSKPIEVYIGQPWDYVITVCDSAHARCPVFPGGTKRLHWSVGDPSHAAGVEADYLKAFRQIRDEICTRIGEWLDELEQSHS